MILLALPSRPRNCSPISVSLVSTSARVARSLPSNNSDTSTLPSSSLKATSSKSPMRPSSICSTPALFSPSRLSMNGTTASAPRSMTAPSGRVSIICAALPATLVMASLRVDTAV
ncbi:hypothetical protein D3C71_1641950 [compost metagenome]